MNFRLHGLKILSKVVRELEIGLRNLKFTDNFQSFETTLVISATSEIELSNELKSKPTKFIIVDQLGNGVITRSATNEWTRDKVYIYNHGAVEVTVTLIIME